MKQFQDCQLNWPQKQLLVLKLEELERRFIWHLRKQFDLCWSESENLNYLRYHKHKAVDWQLLEELQMDVCTTTEFEKLNNSDSYARLSNSAHHVSITWIETQSFAFPVSL